jgi:hypothetical protein
VTSQKTTWPAGRPSYVTARPSTEDLAVQAQEALPGERSVSAALVGVPDALNHCRAVVGMDEIENGPAHDCVVRGDPQGPQGLRVGEDDPSLHVDGHRHRQRVDQLPVALLALAQSFL